MKKILILIFLSFGLQAGNVNTDFAKSTKTQKKVKNKKDMIISKEEITRHTKEYQEVLGIDRKEYKKLINKYYKEDTEWKKANYYLYISKRDIEIKIKDDITLHEKNKSKKIKTKIPEWRKALESFKASCIEFANPISAAQGLDILLINLSMFDNTGKISSKKLNKFFDDYLLVFTKVLRSQEICYGFVGETLYYADRKKRINTAKNVINKGWNICKDQVEKNGVPKYLFDTLRFKSAKINAIIKIRKAKGSI